MVLKLPNSIGGKRDLILVMRTVEKSLNVRLQDEGRKKFGAQEIGGTSGGQKILNELLALNNMNNDTANLQKVLTQLEGYKQHAPRIRISFSQEPENDAYQKIISWFRSEIHPSVLIQVGVQPNIGGGFIMQTPARRYDMSLRTRILNSTDKFLEILHPA